MNTDLKDYEDTLGSMNYGDLAQEFKYLRESMDEAKKLHADLWKRYEVLTTQVLPDRMAEDGFKNITLEGVGRFQASEQARCSTREGQKEALFQWLQDNGFEDLITEVVNPSTLKAFVKECRDGGRPVPPDEIVNYEPYTRVTLVKS